MILILFHVIFLQTFVEQASWKRQKKHNKFTDNPYSFAQKIDSKLQINGKPKWLQIYPNQTKPRQVKPRQSQNQCSWSLPFSWICHAARHQESQEEQKKMIRVCFPSKFCPYFSARTSEVSIVFLWLFWMATVNLWQYNTQICLCISLWYDCKDFKSSWVVKWCNSAISNRLKISWPTISSKIVFLLHNPKTLIVLLWDTTCKM